jgi:two-component system, sensor histidine kinase and response regulator
MSESAFNPAAIERLIKLGGQKFAADMMEMFSSYGGKKLAEARQAQLTGNLAALAASAHPLKSSAGNVGAVRVQDLAAQVEQAAEEQKADVAAARLTELEAAFAEARTFLEQEKLKQTKPSS